MRDFKVTRSSRRNVTVARERQFCHGYKLLCHECKIKCFSHNTHESPKSLLLTEMSNLEVFQSHNL